MNILLTYPIIATIALGFGALMTFLNRNPPNDLMFALAAAFLPVAYFFPHPDVNITHQLIGAGVVFVLGIVVFMTGILRAGGVLKAFVVIALWVPVSRYIDGAVVILVGAAIYVFAYAVFVKLAKRDTSVVPHYATIILVLATVFVGINMIEPGVIADPDLDLDLDPDTLSVTSELRQ